MIPTLEVFKTYAFEKIRAKKDNPGMYTDWLEDKYEAWKLADWKKERNGKFIEIKIWKSTLLQCLPHRVANKVDKLQTRATPLKSTGKVDSIENMLIVSAWNHLQIMRHLELKHEECFNFFMERGLFKKGSVISEKTGKPWQDFYDKLLPNAKKYAAISVLNEPDKETRIKNIKEGTDPLLTRFVKLEALKVHLKRFKTEDDLIKAL